MASTVSLIFRRGVLGVLDEIQLAEDAVNTLKPALLLSLGPFGSAVARQLKTLRRDFVGITVAGSAFPTDSRWTTARMYIVASWRPVADLCESITNLSCQQERPFVPLVMDSAMLRLGPVFIPGQGGCWDCWTRRSRQHSPSREEHSALADHYATHPDDGPQGYLEPFALIGAARISAVMDAADSLFSMGGYLWQIDLMTRIITTGKVVGIHDCPRCGLHRPPTTRTFSEMRGALAHLWTGDVDNGK
jgi:bacteriocin biosynthesis cyclodehydratase domain-containing protein